MKWVTCLSVVMLMTVPAMAEITAVGTWNTGPEPWTGYGGGGNAAAGLEWVRFATGVNNGPVNGITCLPTAGPDWPEALPDIGKWGGGLYDEPVESQGMYVTVKSAPVDPDAEINALVDAQGTLEFWFKPDWDPDPVLETDKHAIIWTSSPADIDGMHIVWEGDGTMATEFIVPGTALELGHAWTSPALINDWNHLAFVWDDVGNYTYANGNKVGETIYSGPAPAKVEWGANHYIMLGQAGNIPPYTGLYSADGTYDALACWDEVLYSGPTLTMPTEEPVPPVDLMGDRNLDGFVGQADLDIILAMWGNSGGDITDLRADVNEDDFVGQTDLDYVLAEWGQGVPLTAPVPEPATLSLLALGGLALIRRRRA